MTVTVHSNNTITKGNNARPVARIDQDSYQFSSGHRQGRTRVKVCDTGDTIEMVAALYVPRHVGSASDWTVNPAFETELLGKLGE